MTNTSNLSQDIELTTKHKVNCNGGGGALGHPLVFMEMGADDEVVCGYCGRRFILKGGKADPGRG